MTADVVTSAQIGAIYKASQSLRLGLSLDSPTYYTISEETEQYLRTSGENGEVVINPNVINIYQDYEFQTPAKATGSIAYVFGAGGFIGRHLIRELTKLDYRIKVATRNPYLKGYLKPLGNPGQIELFKTNIFNSEDVKRILSNCDLAVNLVGILYEKRKQNDS